MKKFPVEILLLYELAFHSFRSKNLTLVETNGTNGVR